MRTGNYHWLQPRKMTDRTATGTPVVKAPSGVTMSEKALRMPAEGVGTNAPETVARHPRFSCHSNNSLAVSPDAKQEANTSGGAGSP
jgi:hypothetical protein